MNWAMGKDVFSDNANNEGPDQLVHLQSDHNAPDGVLFSTENY